MLNTQEAWQLLTLASARDGRTVDKPTAAVWANDLAWVRLDDAVHAATEHYRQSTAWLMPAHVIQGARRIKEHRERLDRGRQQQAIKPNVVTMPPPDVWARMVEQAKQEHRKNHGSETV